MEAKTAPEISATQHSCTWANCYEERERERECRVCVWRPLNEVVVSVAGSGCRLIQSPLCASGFVGPCLKSRFSRLPCPNSLEINPLQSQPLRAWHASWDLPLHTVPSSKSLEVNPCNLSRWEHDREVGTYTRIPTPKSLDVSLSNPSYWDHGMEVGTYHNTRGPRPKSQVTWGKSEQSEPLRSWNGSWDLPLHTGAKSQVTWGQSEQSERQV